MRVSEIFYSIQGESTRAGLPCIFVRLSGCNLSCSYCDTTYAREEGMEMDMEEVLQRIRSFPSKRVEITGGEPLLQEETPRLLVRLLDEGYEVLLETNGSVDLRGVDRRVIKIVDVKTPGSGSGGTFLLGNLSYLNPWDEVKFVIGDRRDYEWSKGFIEEHSLRGRVKILLSPVHGRLDPSLLAEWILRDGLDVCLQIQIHKVIWGEKRGR